MSDPAAAPRVEVIVVTYQSAAVIQGLLKSLEQGMAGTDWGLHVVDNASTDATRDLLDRWAGPVDVIESGGNIGFAAAVNLGFQECGDDSDVLVLNADARLGREAAARLQRALRQRVDGGARVGIAAPRTVDGDGRMQLSLRREPSIFRALAETALGVGRSARLGLGEAIGAHAAYAKPTVADWASGAALMISAECRRACGPLDESFFLYSEDTEYALRARDGGYLTVLIPDALVIHAGGMSREDPRLWSLLVLNKLALYRRRHGRLRAAVFRLACLVRELRLAATGHRPSRAAAAALLRR